ncbi:PREDICTED: trafficking protein particle complex subunit 8 [Nicrophorus vespilloides]|uniref:Trafficking protein particle complex subunit 8 n=1 Tax=Nicrophorus vespilloides TaxID=110193 RepID=A0ABM1M137_NICVS|nr:PREDICTED: trafficking protein particle complex subunit 8 [Nicrophorus vespilloides]
MMAQFQNTPQEFIKDTFSPQIGVLCSQNAEEICRKNNLSFIELVQPFCKLNSEVRYRDPNGAIVSLRNLKVSMLDINAKPPIPAIARKFLNLSVSEAPCPRPFQYNAGDHELTIPSSAPWFETWRETFFQVQYPADHEFTKHFVACVLVVASSDTNPIDSLHQLSQSLNHMQTVSIAKLPKWFNNNVLRYYVILHETIDTDHIRINDIYESMKGTYGNGNCFLMKTNSRSPNVTGEQLPDPWCQFINHNIQSASTMIITPETSPNMSRALTQSLEMGQEVIEDANNILNYHPLSPDGSEEQEIADSISQMKIDEKKSEIPVLHGGCLSTEDVEQIKLFIHDFCTRALLPYIEKQILNLSDMIANKKGVSKSLFSATKRWFTPNKPTSNSATINTLTYPQDAPELHIRKLGDLYFMFGNYSMAFQAYHSAKRDFMADQAWLYYAGALEMAALSAFMGNESSRKSFDYMEESIITYLNTCKMAQFATRATLLSTECLRGQNMHAEAANQLIRMTSEESDLRSALLLEQASYCFLLCTKPNMVRKYAFHMVLAGHRFTKAAQRKHSLRCYKQAYQIYENKGWNLAQDHIYYTIGCLANNLNEHEEAVQSYSKLLTGESKQSSAQQAKFLKEYLNIHNELLKKQNNLLTQVLPLPTVRNETIRILVGPGVPLRTPGKVPAIGINLKNQGDLATRQKWNKLEEMLVQEAQGSLPMIFKPLVTLFNMDNINTVNPIAIMGEPIQVAVELENPLQILLNLKDIYLLWQFKDDNNRFAVNEIMGHNLDHIMKTQIVKSVVIQANSTEEVILSITPMAVGNVSVKGICYSLISSNAENEIGLRGKQIFNFKGPKQKNNCSDSNFELKIVPSAPCLQISFGEMNSELLRNELQEISVELRNVGSVPLHKVYLATAMPHLLSSCEFQSNGTEFLDAASIETTASREREARKNHVSHLPLPNGVLEPGQYYNVFIWLKAPETIGPALIDLLIYYENFNSSSIPRYRLIRHMWNLHIQESIRVEVNAKQSWNSKNIEQLVLTIKAINLNKIHHAVVTEITLIKVALLSQNWILSKDVSSPKNIKLDTQESVNIFMKIDRKASKISNYSEMSFISTKQMNQQSQYAYLDFAKRNDQSRINIFDNIESLDSYKKHDGTLILRWQAIITDSEGQKRMISGQNHIPVDVTTVEETLVEDCPAPNYSFERIPIDLQTEETDKLVKLNDKQITYNIVHPPVVCHNFDQSKLCIVPLNLHLHSVSETQIVVKICTIGTSSSSPMPHRPGLYYPFSSTQFRWIKTGSIVRTIEPFSSLNIQLSIAALCPGTYDLGSRIEVYCHQVDQLETAVLQSCRVQSSLIITGGNS